VVPRFLHSGGHCNRDRASLEARCDGPPLADHRRNRRFTGKCERIQDFIERSIRNSDVVVSIVSTRSLLSPWVAVETINTFHRRKWDGKVFIGALLSDEFFRPEFRLECTRLIDERLQTIDNLLPEYREKKIDSVDLNEEKTRLYDLRNNLGSILANLKASLCLSLREEDFTRSC
jgi:hypothetical protein